LRIISAIAVVHPAIKYDLFIFDALDEIVESKRFAKANFVVCGSRFFAYEKPLFIEFVVNVRLHFFRFPYSDYYIVFLQ
jgi:hypothetical protein